MEFEEKKKNKMGGKLKEKRPASPGKRDGERAKKGQLCKQKRITLLTRKIRRVVPEKEPAEKVYMSRLSVRKVNFPCGMD